MQESGVLIQWFKEIEEDQMPIVNNDIGNLKISFMYAFYFLRKCSSDTTAIYNYERCIADMLLLGGDTDTNAAIVGGLIGAYYGIAGIPLDWIELLLSFDV